MTDKKARLGKNEDTICAIASPAGTGAVAMIRLSGKDAFSITQNIFKSSKKDFLLEKVDSHTVHFGHIYSYDELIDEVLLSVYRKPHSYTGEDSVEITCHGSYFIQKKILELLIDQGARTSNPGEFTMRAFVNGKMDLSQAEAVAELIASNSASSHKVAIQQMRGGYSKKIKTLREQLLDFASLIELELDFSEEDVEFANRAKLLALLDNIKQEIDILIRSFSLGNVLKNGIPVAITGKPNVGKSTLLNAILNEERAIVSEIPGTTRDSIEDTIVIDGILFRFIDTAGLRKSQDTIETFGIERTYETIEKASLVLFLFDVNETTVNEVVDSINEFKERFPDQDKKYIIIANKIDLMVEVPHGFKDYVDHETIFISAKRKENIQSILESLVKSVKTKGEEENNILVSNIRHYEAMKLCLQSVNEIEKGIQKHISPEWLVSDVKQAICHLAQITGDVTSEDILDSIFSRFCIGK